MTPEERRKRMGERLASMSPEERAQWEERMRQRGGGGGSGLGGNPQGGGRGGNQVMASRDPGRGMTRDATQAPTTQSGAMTIDSLFAPLVPTESRGRLWIYENKQLRSVAVRLGITDSQFTELLEGDIKEGQELVVNMVSGLEPANRPGQTGAGNPLMGPQRGGPGGGGGRGPGGGGRGF
jgi:hypothetical protein